MFLILKHVIVQNILHKHIAILGFQLISQDATDNVIHSCPLDPTMLELTTYSFLLCLQHGRRDVKCKPLEYMNT